MRIQPNPGDAQGTCYTPPLGGAAHVGDDESDARNKLAGVPFDLADHISSTMPFGGQRPWTKSIRRRTMFAGTMPTSAIRREAGPSRDFLSSSCRRTG